MDGDLESRVRKIEERNQTVEADKAWETSVSRKLLLTLFTYGAISAYLWVIKVDRPFLSAIVPAVAFMLSTLVLPIFKKMWLKSLKQS